MREVSTQPSRLPTLMRYALGALEAGTVPLGEAECMPNIALTSEALLNGFRGNTSMVFSAHAENNHQ